jgi:hypothetical protein
MCIIGKILPWSNKVLTATHQTFVDSSPNCPENIYGTVPPRFNTMFGGKIHVVLTHFECTNHEVYPSVEAKINHFTSCYHIFGTKT